MSPQFLQSDDPSRLHRRRPSRGCRTGAMASPCAGEFAKAFEPHVEEAESPGEVVLVPERSWGGRSPSRPSHPCTGAKVATITSVLLLHPPLRASPGDFQRPPTSPTVTADDNPYWMIDLNEEVTGLGVAGAIAAETLHDRLGHAPRARRAVATRRAGDRGGGPGLRSPTSVHADRGGPARASRTSTLGQAVDCPVPALGRRGLYRSDDERSECRKSRGRLDFGRSRLPNGW